MVKSCVVRLVRLDVVWEPYKEFSADVQFGVDGNAAAHFFEYLAYNV